jgi:release factor glutamine methyltransferase
VTTVGELVREGREELRRIGLQAAGREAARLLGGLLDWNEARVLARDADPVPPETERRFRDLLGRRREGEPVAYLLGEREFFGRPFTVDSRVLIPAPKPSAQSSSPPCRCWEPARSTSEQFRLAVTLAAERPAGPSSPPTSRSPR